MTNSASKFLLPVGMSVLALIAFQAPVVAQDIPLQELSTAADEPLLPDMAGDTADVPVLVMPEDAAEDPTPAGPDNADREIAEEVDPVVAAELRRLDAMGTLERQASMGEDILIIDREIKRAEAIERLIGYLGADGFKLHYPMLAQQLENSPIMLTADLERHKLLGEIEVAKAGPTAKEATTAPAARDDGSSFLEGGAIAMPEAVSEVTQPSALLGPDGKFSPEVARLLADEIRKIAAETAKIEEIAASSAGRVRGLSLRGVHGTGDALVAVLSRDGEQMVAKVGDKLPDDTVVEAIDLESITLLRSGSVVKLDLGG
ncbi:hypothetical protein [Paracoccus sp. ME4]|uniref:hypothetical protein n=1 Tax=Paracoccus sp. ME4 TaxID=3138066 RepID=UPI00398B1212